MASPRWGGIGCYAGCEAPVIGQCHGYQGPCGQFYCREHSGHKLCRECFLRAVDDVLAAILAEDYSRKANELKWKSIGLAAKVAFIGLLPGILIASIPLHLGSGVYAAASLSAFLAHLLSYPWRLKVYNRELTQLDNENPGFRMFINERANLEKRKVLKEMGGALLAVAAVVIASGAVVSQALREDATRRAIMNIDRHVSRLIG